MSRVVGIKKGFHNTRLFCSHQNLKSFVAISSGFFSCRLLKQLCSRQGKEGNLHAEYWIQVILSEGFTKVENNYVRDIKTKAKSFLHGAQFKPF
jgi:hypothetical protein